MVVAVLLEKYLTHSSEAGVVVSVIAIVHVRVLVSLRCGSPNSTPYLVPSLLVQNVTKVLQPVLYGSTDPPPQSFKGSSQNCTALNPDSARLSRVPYGTPAHLGLDQKKQQKVL